MRRTFTLWPGAELRRRNFPAPVIRYLKQANVKVRADGTVKVLDFGLAKAIDRAGGSGARHRGCRHALLVAGLARPGVLRRRDAEARVGGGPSPDLADHHGGGTDAELEQRWPRDPRRHVAGQIAAYPVSTAGGFSHGQPTTLVRDVGYTAAFSSATRDHSRILIRVSPDAAKDKGEIQLLIDWQEALRQSKR